MISFKNNFKFLKLNRDFQDSIHNFKIRLRFLELKAKSRFLRFNPYLSN